MSKKELANLLIRIKSAKVSKSELLNIVDNTWDITIHLDAASWTDEQRQQVKNELQQQREHGKEVWDITLNIAKT